MRIGRNCRDLDPWCIWMPSLLVGHCVGMIGPIFHLVDVFFLFASVWMSSLFMVLVRGTNLLFLTLFSIFATARNFLIDNDFVCWSIFLVIPISTIPARWQWEED